jgi:hypothetical protein
LKELVSNNELLGKYNKKFVNDWAPKIAKLLAKIGANDPGVINDIKTIRSHIDPSSNENEKTVGARMKEFVKLSDGSLFFEEYTAASDWAKI